MDYDNLKTLELIKKITFLAKSYPIETSVAALAACLGLALSTMDEEERSQCRAFIHRTIDATTKAGEDAQGPWANLLVQIMALG